MLCIARPLWGRKENGLPRAFGPRNDRGNFLLVLFIFTMIRLSDPPTIEHRFRQFIMVVAQLQQKEGRILPY